jgi:hypothetical protein
MRFDALFKGGVKDAGVCEEGVPKVLNELKGYDIVGFWVVALVAWWSSW